MTDQQILNASYEDHVRGLCLAMFDAAKLNPLDAASALVAGVQLAKTAKRVAAERLTEAWGPDTPTP